MGQTRLAVVFHRLIMPDGYTVDLDQFQGLNQIGETGLKDKVNHHYLQIFGASIAVGAIGGLAEAGTNTTSLGLAETPADAYRQRFGVPSGFLIFARLNSRRGTRCHPFFAVSGSPLPLQKK